MSVVDDVEIGHQTIRVDVYQQPAVALLRIHSIVQNALNRMTKSLDAATGHITLMHERESAHGFQYGHRFGELLARTGGQEG